MAVFFKPSNMDPVTEDGPHTHRFKRPQLVFILGIIVFALFTFQEGLQYNRLTGLFPVVAASATLICIAPLVFVMMTRNAPSSYFFDAERKNMSRGHQTAEFYIGILLAMLLFSGLVGFVLGIATFISLFLWRGATVVWWKATLGGGAFILFLGILSEQLTLRYPTGLLQNLISLPWPFQ
jgi:hypothetical protein